MIKNFKVGDHVQVQPGHPDTERDLDHWGWWYRDFLSGKVGVVVQIDRGLKIQMESLGQIDSFYESDDALLRYIAVVIPEGKATLEDAEMLLTLVQELEDTEVQIISYEVELGEARNEAATLEKNIAALKNKLNIA